MDYFARTRCYFIWTKETGERELVRSADLITQDKTEEDLRGTIHTVIHIEKADRNDQWINVNQLEFLGLFSVDNAPTKI